MLAKQEIRFRAVKMGIATGNMPNADLMWKIQKMDNHAECFGQGAGCPNEDCQWRSKCLAVGLFEHSLLTPEVPQKQSA